ncbi:MAG: uracil-DNA glycosylase family protein [Prevotella sp.]
MSRIDSASTALPPVERHPFEPFLPEGCRLLMLGSFPPSPKRWAMRFYYPNYTNDMWRIFGLCFRDDRNAFVDEVHKTFRQDALVDFLTQRRIGLYDTACAVRRLKNTASDKDLEVVEPTDVPAMLRGLPQCRAVAVTGQKAAEVMCACFDIHPVPAVGAMTEFGFEGRTLRLYRMPSSSRAYPMKAEDKAVYYKRMFDAVLNEK